MSGQTSHRYFVLFNTVFSALARFYHGGQSLRLYHSGQSSMLYHSSQSTYQPGFTSSSLFTPQATHCRILSRAIFDGQTNQVVVQYLSSRRKFVAHCGVGTPDPWIIQSQILFICYDLIKSVFSGDHLKKNRKGGSGLFFTMKKLEKINHSHQKLWGCCYFLGRGELKHKSTT